MVQYYPDVRKKKKNCQNIILFLVKIHWSNDDISRVCKSYVYVM